MQEPSGDSKHKICISVLGGIVTDVYSTTPDIEVRIMDFDVLEEEEGDTSYISSRAEDGTLVFVNGSYMINRTKYPHEIA